MLFTHYNGHEEWNLLGTVGTKGRTTDAAQWQAVAANDFDGTGSGCDIVWHWNCSDGGHNWHNQLGLTRQNASELRAPDQAEIFASAPSSEWELVGSGQFTADRRADLLWWNNQTGDLRLWASDGTGFPSSTDLQVKIPDVQWRPSAVLDIDDDGDGDIIWRHTASGALAYWRMQLVDRVESGSFTPSSLADPCWQLVATGDFNGDGHDDILWQNQNSQKSVVWFMQGAQRIGGSFLSPDRFGTANSSLELTCPAPCLRDCSTEGWYIVGPR